MSTPQLCDALAESSRFIAVAGGTMHSLSADGQKQQQPYFSSRSNFDQNSTLPMRDLDSFRGAETRPTGYIHGKVKDFDHYGVAESAWGYASLWQLEALQKQETAAKYARTRGTATLRDSDSDDYALPAMNENRERPPSIFDKTGSVGCQRSRIDRSRVRQNFSTSRSRLLRHHPLHGPWHRLQKSQPSIHGE